MAASKASQTASHNSNPPIFRGGAPNIRSRARSARRSRTALHKAINTLSPAVTSSIPASAFNTLVPTPTMLSKRVISSAGAAACISVLVLINRGKVTAANGVVY